MSKGRPDERARQTSNIPPDGVGARQAPEGSTSGSPSPQPSEEPRPYYEALAQRINDTYARFTPEQMELVKALGWG